MKHVLCMIAILLGSISLTASVTLPAVHVDVPDGETGPKADSLAHVMLDAVNDSAWQATRYVEWTFPGGHHYLWDKERHFVQVKWDDNTVLFHTRSQQGIARREETKPITENGERRRLIENAIDMFNNDSFWLCAHYKLFDPGTERKFVTTEKSERPALLITYNSGGSTPGDSYLWLLDENGVPEAWKMWVSVLPEGGVKFTRERWITTSTDAKFALEHKSTVNAVTLRNVRTYQHLRGEDPFEALESEE